MVSASKMIELSYRLTPKTEAWELPEIPVPESHAHNLLVTYLFEVLSAWVEREKREALVVRNLAQRWMEAHPRVGLDPDVALIEPAPPDSKQLTSLCTGKTAHMAPRLAIEVVSESHPYKDYLGDPRALRRLRRAGTLGDRSGTTRPEALRWATSASGVAAVRRRQLRAYLFGRPLALTRNRCMGACWRGSRWPLAGRRAQRRSGG